MNSILFEQLNELDEELITSFFDSYLIDYLVELK